MKKLKICPEFWHQWWMQILLEWGTPRKWNSLPFADLVVSADDALRGNV